MKKEQKELLINKLNKLALKSILHQRKTGEKLEYNFLEIDNNKCTVKSDPERIGPFQDNYYKIYVKVEDA